MNSASRPATTPAKRVDSLYAGPHGTGGRRLADTHIQTLTDGREIAISHQPMDGGGWVANYRGRDRTAGGPQARITFLARHDALTSLPNPALFPECLDQALSRYGRGPGFAVLFIDLDHFKPVNDTFGHPVGDRLLRAVADRLRQCARDTDTVARLGGAEFAVAGRRRAAEDAAELATGSCGRWVEPFDLGEQQIQIGASVGIAIGGADGTTIDALLKNADLAPHRAKLDGALRLPLLRTRDGRAPCRAPPRAGTPICARRPPTRNSPLDFIPLMDLRTNRLKPASRR